MWFSSKYLGTSWYFMVKTSCYSFIETHLRSSLLTSHSQRVRRLVTVRQPMMRRMKNRSASVTGNWQILSGTQGTEALAEDFCAHSGSSSNMLFFLDPIGTKGSTVLLTVAYSHP